MKPLDFSGINSLIWRSATNNRPVIEDFLSENSGDWLSISYVRKGAGLLAEEPPRMRDIGYMCARKHLNNMAKEGLVTKKQVFDGSVVRVYYRK